LSIGGWELSEEDFIKRVEPLLKKKEYKTTLKLAEKEAKKNPDNPFAWYALGVSLLNLKKFNKANDAFTSFINNKRANQAWGNYYLAESFVGLKDYSKAVSYYKKSLEHDPKYRKAFFGLESCYRKLNDIENAIKINLTITQLYPREKQPWYWLSVIHLVKEDFSKAYSYILRALRNASKDKEVLNLYNEIKSRYEEKTKSETDTDALKEIEFGEIGYGSLYLNDKELNSLKQIKSLDITRLNLFRLILNHNEIKEISCLDDFPELNYLELNDNKISNLMGFGNLPKLQSLKLEGNIIQKISGLNKMANLSYLYLGDNQLTKIEGLLNLDLRILDLSNNQLEKIEGLEQQKNLIKLDLSNNLIIEITGLNNQNAMTNLNLSNNQLSSLKGCFDIRHVEILNLSNNNLSNLENIQVLKKLKNLNLEGNQNLPAYFATKYEDAKSITNLHQYSSFTNEELTRKSNEILEKIKKDKAYKEKVKEERIEREAIEKKKKIEREAFFGGSSITSTYGGKQNLRDRLQALLKVNEEGTCLYCRDKIPDNGNCEELCASVINQLVKETNNKLPRSAKDRNNFRERTVTDQVTNRRMDIYDRPGYSTVQRTIKDYSNTSVGKFSLNHFPKLIGSVCKNCSDNFIRKTSKHFKRLQRRGYKPKHFSDKIQKSMEHCHEEYLKELVSMIGKRGF